jgi:SAM-dependent methyltransferase/uncharacterized protein YbaR (Trm112 family)
MQPDLLNIIRCPVTRMPLRLDTISRQKRQYHALEYDHIWEGILWGGDGWFYPVIDGVPRLLVESFLDFEEFFCKHLNDYDRRRNFLQKKYFGLINYVIKKNKRTKQSFTQEWNLQDPHKDRTWDEDVAGIQNRFFREIDSSANAIKGKLIFDAGCGNGLLDTLLAERGAKVLAMDFSQSIEAAFIRNTHPDAWFIQGDVQFPPVAFMIFDIVHCSGVLIHTNNSEVSFSILSPCVKPGCMLSVWLYHPRKDVIHKLFNRIRKITSRLPINLQYYLYSITLLPMSFIVKRYKGNTQTKREMMIDILDWFSPQYRWEHTHTEVVAWFYKNGFETPKITTQNKFGFNIIGKKAIQNPAKPSLSTNNDKIG